MKERKEKFSRQEVILQLQGWAGQTTPAYYKTSEDLGLGQ